MDKYTTNDSSFTMEDLQRAMKLVELPVVDFTPLNDYINAGNKMTNTLTMLTSQEVFKDIPEINTIHGKLKIQYSRYIEPDKVYFMSPPKLEDLFGFDSRIGFKQPIEPTE